MFPKLSSYPKLATWFAHFPDAPPNEANSTERFVWSISRAFSVPDPILGLKIWFQAIQQFFQVEQASEKEFGKAEEIFEHYQFDFLQSASEVLEYALTQGHGERSFALMQSIADKVGLNVFRFLAAWAALNINRLEECISECEKINDPFACVFTLQGQACLELGRISEAIENLNLSVELNPEDVMTHFQLAKAYFVKNEFVKAWEQLEACSQLRPGHPEVLAMQSMTAVAYADCDLGQFWLHGLVPELLDAVKQEPWNSMAVHIAMEAILHQRTPDHFQGLVAIADWNSARKDPEFLANIPEILRAIEARGWKSEASSLLSKLTESA